VTAETPPPRLTKHALERWAYRFDGFDLVDELRSARPIPYSRLAKAKLPIGRPRDGYRYLFARHSRAVFVVSGDNSITTVMKLLAERNRTGGHKARLENRRYTQHRR
jgi:hypothetical protein